MTDQNHKDIQIFRELWSKLNEVNKEKALELAAQMLAEQLATKGNANDRNNTKSA